MEKSLKASIRAVPHEPGIYIYRNTSGDVIYVGKARDLSKRVRQYFQRDGTMGGKTARLVSEIATIETVATTSEFDALLLEAKLIRSYLPKYNVVSRDDKSPLYVVITLSETLPRLILVRRGDLPQYESTKKNRIYGPFQSGFVLRTILRQLRNIVPYCTQKERHGRACFYTHLGLCGPCPAAIVGMTGEEKTRATREYRKHIYQVNDLFEGNIRSVSRSVEREMSELAREQKFEQAAAAKERLRRLYELSQHRYDPQVFLERGAEDIYQDELQELLEILRSPYPSLSRLSRIECYDISNLMGQQAVGSMVVLENGKPAKNQYRRFRIKTVHGISDVAMMREVLTRRLNHGEWPEPDFLIVDGGKTQVNAAKEALATQGRTIPLAGLAKRQEELIIPRETGGYTTLRLSLSGKAIKVMMRIRDEAHRFAITYHRLLRKKTFLGPDSNHTVR